MSRADRQSVRVTRPAAGIAGLPAAERALSHAGSATDKAVRLAVVGPAGSGKTALLAELADALAAGGAEVLLHAATTGPVELEEAAGRGAVVVVDDAHAATPEVLTILRSLRSGPGGLVVAARSWPRPDGLPELLDELRADGDDVELLPLDLDGVVRRVEAIVGSRPHPSPCQFLLETTGGVPRLLDAALHLEGAHGACGAAFDAVGWHAEVTRLVRGSLVALDARAREVLLAVALGADAGPVVVSSVLGMPTAEAQQQLDLLEAEGLIRGSATEPWYEIQPVARDLVAHQWEPEQRRRLQERIVESVLGGPRPDLASARRLAVAGCVDQRLAQLLLDEAHRVMRRAPELACELVTEAQLAGMSTAAAAAVRAQAAVRAGDLDLAVLSADEVMCQPDHPHLPTAAQAAAVAYAHRGMLARSAELYRYVGQERIGADAAEAAIALVATGDLTAAAPMLAVADQAGPTSLARGLALTATGLRESLQGDGTAGLCSLTQAVTVMSPAGSGSLLLDTPASLAALVALHCGALDVAESVLVQAESADLGGALFRARHRLLLSWTAMLRGDLDRAARLTDEVMAEPSLPTRDLVLGHALRVGLARRSNDVETLTAAWPEAHDLVAGHATDLFTLLPLGELMIAAAHLRAGHRLQARLDEALQVLHDLGDPALWGAPLHWYGVQTAILREQPHALIPHAEALVRASRTSQHAATLATAGQTWLKVLSGDGDPEQVGRAVDGLVTAGLPLDASRLAGQAAARATTREARLELLQLARRIRHLENPADTSVPPTVAAPGSPADAGRAKLSDREWEVAQLVALGLPYREIGQRLFISPKTVEHHVARIRSHLGAANRREMLSVLRGLVAAAADPRDHDLGRSVDGA